jgi:hypothetical protein
MSTLDDRSLVDAFVATFTLFDDMIEMGSNPVAAELAVTGPDEHGWREWRLGERMKDPIFLEPIYSMLPACFPQLIEIASLL